MKSMETIKLNSIVVVQTITEDYYYGRLAAVSHSGIELGEAQGLRGLRGYQLEQILRTRSIDSAWYVGAVWISSHNLATVIPWPWTSKDFSDSKNPFEIIENHRRSQDYRR